MIHRMFGNLQNENGLPDWQVMILNEYAILFGKLTNNSSYNNFVVPLDKNDLSNGDCFIFVYKWLVDTEISFL